MLTPEEIQTAQDFIEIAIGCVCLLSADSSGRLSQFDRSCPMCIKFQESIQTLKETQCK